MTFFKQNDICPWRDKGPFLETLSKIACPTDIAAINHYRSPFPIIRNKSNRILGTYIPHGKLQPDRKTMKKL